MTGAFILNTGSGGGYLLDGSNYASWDDTTDNLSDMAIFSSGTYAYVSQLSQEQGTLMAMALLTLSLREQIGIETFRQFH